jgi:hypothetical protein
VESAESQSTFQRIMSTPSLGSNINFNGMHGIIPQKVIIITNVRTSNPTHFNFYCTVF